MNALGYFVFSETKPFVELLFKRLENQGQSEATEPVTAVKVKEEPDQDKISSK